MTEIQNENGELIDVEKNMCDIVGSYFSSVFSPRYNGELPAMEEMYEREIRDIVVTRENVQEKLEKLNVYKSCGPDGVHPFVLQATASAASVPLEKIFNKSLSTGECPTDWKNANVTPIHKKGD